MIDPTKTGTGLILTHFARFKPIHNYDAVAYIAKKCRILMGFLLRGRRWQPLYQVLFTYDKEPETIAELSANDTTDRHQNEI